MAQLLINKTDEMQINNIVLIVYFVVLYVFVSKKGCVSFGYK